MVDPLFQFVTIYAALTGVAAVLLAGQLRDDPDFTTKDVAILAVCWPITLGIWLWANR